MIEHVVSTLKQINRQEAYEYYITDALKHIVNNTAEQESRTIIKMSFRDMMNPVTVEDEIDNDKKAKDIIANMKKKLGGS